MHRRLSRFVSRIDFLDSAANLNAYSRDGSGMKGRPHLILRPRDIEELRKIVVFSNRFNIPLVPRGSGTGICGGAVGKDMVIIHTHHFNKLHRLDRQLHTVDVGAGITYRRLTELLSRTGFWFPLEPENQESTLGGLVATNCITEESLLYGDYGELVERIEFIDGGGRHHIVRGKKRFDVIGREGTTGIIVGLRLKLKQIPSEVSIDLIEVENEKDINQQARRISQEEGILLLEYLDKQSSQAIGLRLREMLLVAYTDMRGSIHDPDRVRRLIRSRKGLRMTLHNRGFTAYEECTVEEPYLLKFLKVCAEKGLVCFGHLGLGLLVVAGRKSERLRNLIISMKGVPGGKYGYGRLKKEYVPHAVRHEVMMLKERLDYKNIMNRGIFT